MTANGELNVVPVRRGSMLAGIAKVVEALETCAVDDKRTAQQCADEKVAAVDRRLGRKASRRDD